MIVFESRKSRCLVARAERGEEVVATIEALARREGIRAAWVRGAGSVAWVELDRHDQARRIPEPPQRFDTPCEILSLQGSIAMSGGVPRAFLYAAISRRTDNGIDVLGGRLRAGEAFAVELVIECFDDLELSRARDEDTGLALFSGERAPGGALLSGERAPGGDEVVEYDQREVEARPRGAISWADVAAVSAAPPVVERSRRERQRPAPPAPTPAFRPPPIPERPRTSDVAILEEPMPQKGDWIEHRQFGLCKIEREDDEGGLVIRLPSGVRKTIKLDFMEVGQPREEGGRTIYPVRPRRR